MAWFLLARAIFLGAVTYTAGVLLPLEGSGVVANAALGAAIALAAIALEWRTREVCVPRILGAVIGAALGLFFAKLLTGALMASTDTRWVFVQRVILLLFPYLGLIIGARRGEWLQPARLVTLFRGTAPRRRQAILDTSVIIDGRIVTNDLNLNKVARLRGVGVLNINDLANAMKPVVLPGEVMTVHILKEGKEYNQGVAYLADGTMVVVDNARRLLNQTIDITVTSVLQTTAGKMIFGRHISPGAAPPGSASREDAKGQSRAGAPQPPAPQSP